MNRTFDTILSLALLHDYYTDGFTSDFVIMPTATTKRLLQQHSWFFRDTSHGFYIGCDNIAMASLPLVLAQKTIRLSFTLRLKSSDFMNFTTLPSRSGSKDIYFLRSQQASQQLAMEAIALYPPVFTYQFPAAGNTTNIQIQDPQGNIRIDQTLDSSPGQELSISVNLEGYGPGLYRFIVEGQPDQNIYITDETPGNGIFGLLEITLPPDFDPQGSSAYQFQFSARASAWEYHLLLGKDYNDHSLTITDTLGGAVFSETQAPPNYNPGSRTVFVSQNPITYRETPRRGIQLSISNIEGSSSYNNLPNPPLGNPESKVYLTI